MLSDSVLRSILSQKKKKKKHQKNEKNPPDWQVFIYTKYSNIKFRVISWQTSLCLSKLAECEWAEVHKKPHGLLLLVLPQTLQGSDIQQYTYTYLHENDSVFSFSFSFF